MSKKGGSQTAILQVADKEFLAALDARGADVAQTRLTFGGWRVWQEEQTLHVLMMNEDLTAIVELPREGTAQSVKDGIVKDAGPDVLLVISQGMPPEAKYLEGVQWK